MIQWTECQTKALIELNGTENIFLTGVAGSGKSFLVRHFLKDKGTKEFPVLASTGAAAILLGGRTFHSYFGLGIMEGGVAATVERARKDRRLNKRLNQAQCVLIDEISMISGPTLRAAEEISRMARENQEAWGGLRVIVVGDFAQLPPVSRFSNKKEWAFQDPSWQASRFKPVILQTICRTQDKEFSEVLNFVRNGQLNAEVTNFLNQHKAPANEDSLLAPRLYPRKLETDAFNLKRLESLPGEPTVIETIYGGRSQLVEQLKKQAPISEELILKTDAFIMLRQNDPRGRWVNGSLGFIKHIGQEALLIELMNGRMIELEKSVFSLLDAEANPVATATNFPVSLAYATTIHKSQGATLDKAIVNLKSLWEPGQAYVALSRVKSADSLFIEDWSPSSFRIDQAVVEFQERLFQS